MLLRVEPLSVLEIDRKDNPNLIGENEKFTLIQVESVEVGDFIELERVGTTLNVYKNEELLFSDTDSDYALGNAALRMGYEGGKTYIAVGVQPRIFEA